LRRIFCHIVCFVTACTVFAACNGNGWDRKLPSLRESYKKEDKKPFGGFVAHRLLEQLFPDNIIRSRKESAEDTKIEVSDTSALYVSISNNLFTSDEDVTALMDFVALGNDVVLVGANIDNNLLYEIKCSLSAGSAMTNTFFGRIIDSMSDTQVRLQLPDDTASDKRFGYYYYPFSSYFYNLDTTTTRVLGYNAKGKPNCIVYYRDKGRLFLHCEPRAFSNYFLLQKDNYRYMQTLMGFVRSDPEHVYWNDYYASVNQPQGGGSSTRRNRNTDNDRSGSTFSGLKGPLWTAFWIALVLVLIYILYGMKRRQRRIPEIKPNENTTVTFAETVGLLYLQKKDNRNIADKMITYFNEFVRNQYFLNTNNVNGEFISTLSRKSGVPVQRVETLYRAIANAQQTTTIDDYQLLALNDLIQNFYKFRN
jgi:hypothetical protein